MRNNEKTPKPNLQQPWERGKTQSPHHDVGKKKLANAIVVWFRGISSTVRDQFPRFLYEMTS